MPTPEKTANDAAHDVDRQQSEEAGKPCVAIEDKFGNSGAVFGFDESSQRQQDEQNCQQENAERQGADERKGCRQKCERSGGRGLRLGLGIIGYYLGHTFWA